jgi:predicted TIM-barrel fold metal-dependent hydrolase
LKYSGENNLVIGTDYGHNDTSSEIEALKRIRREGEVSSEVIDKILFDNPKALYNL